MNANSRERLTDIWQNTIESGELQVISHQLGLRFQVEVDDEGEWKFSFFKFEVCSEAGKGFPGVWINTHYDSDCCVGRTSQGFGLSPSDRKSELPNLTPNAGLAFHSAFDVPGSEILETEPSLDPFLSALVQGMEDLLDAPHISVPRLRAVRDTAKRLKDCLSGNGTVTLNAIDLSEDLYSASETGPGRFLAFVRAVIRRNDIRDNWVLSGGRFAVRVRRIVDMRTQSSHWKTEHAAVRGGDRPFENALILEDRAKKELHTLADSGIVFATASSLRSRSGADLQRAISKWSGYRMREMTVEELGSPAQTMLTPLNALIDICRGKAAMFGVAPDPYDAALRTALQFRQLFDSPKSGIVVYLPHGAYQDD